jgi:hypothetical protein
MTPYELQLADGTVIGTGFGKIALAEGHTITCRETQKLYRVLKVIRVTEEDLLDEDITDDEGPMHVAFVEAA